MYQIALVCLLDLYIYTHTKISKFKTKCTKCTNCNVGTLKIKWMEMEAGSMIPFEEFQMLLNDKVDIFRVNRKKPQEAWIFPGKHVYE